MTWTNPLKGQRMKKAWVITASTGEYSDYTEWPIVVLDDGDRAEQLVNKLEAIEQEAWVGVNVPRWSGGAKPIFAKINAAQRELLPESALDRIDDDETASFTLYELPLIGSPPRRNARKRT